jgi:uncharacterized protein YbcI
VSPNRIPNETLAAISDELARLKAQHYGRGPENAKTYLNDDYVFCVMVGGLTRVEQTLVDGGDEALVRQVRLRFQEQMRDAFVSTVERHTRRRVLNYQSQIMLKPDYTVEMFVLGPPLDDVGGEDG